MSYWPPSGAEAANALFGRRSTIVLGLALFVAVVLIHNVIVIGIGDHLAQTRPEVSLKLGRDSPEVLASAALDAWQVKDVRRASNYSLAALDRSPLDARALRVRGLALAAEGKTAEAETVMQFAGTRGWRDDGVQAWLLRDEIAKHHFDLAFQHADALARRRIEMWPVLFRLFVIGVGDPDSAKAIAERLSKKPHWRASFLVDLAASGQRDAPVERLYQMVDQGPSPLNTLELSTYLTRLGREGRYRDALAALRGSRNGRTLTGSPFDGGFSGQAGVAPFAWAPLSSPGANVEMDPAPNRPSSNALRVEYDGYSASDLIRQALAPQPGDYLLTGEALSQDGDPAILTWQARCATDGKVLATAPAPTGAVNSWNRFAVRFTVPAQGCDGVWLVLAETPQDHRSSNVTWYANLAVQPAPATARAK